MKAKVKTIDSCDLWEKTGTYYHKMEMDNGQKINIGKKQKDFFKIGDEIEYEEGEIKYGYMNVKESKQEFKKKSFEKNYKADFISFAMSYAKDMVVSGHVDIKALPLTAEACYKWMCEKYESLSK